MSAPLSMLPPSITAWAIEALIASALLMALVLLVRGPVRRAFGPQIAYVLWALPLLRLVLPPLPVSWRAAAATPISRASETVVVILAPVAKGAPAAGVDAPVPVMSLVTLAVMVWLVGAAIFLVYHLVRHARFCRRIVAAADRIEQQGDIRIVTSAAAPGPLASGYGTATSPSPPTLPTATTPTSASSRWHTRSATTGAATSPPIGQRWRCWRSTGLTRSPGAPFARSGPTRNSPTTRACWRAGRRSIVTSMPVPSSRRRMAAPSPPRATSTPSPTSRGD